MGLLNSFCLCGRSIITQWVRRGYGLKPCGWHNFLAMSTFCGLVFVRDSGKILLCKSLKAKDSNSGIKTLLWENRGNISFLWLGLRQADSETGSQADMKLRKCYGLSKGLKTKK